MFSDSPGASMRDLKRAMINNAARSGSPAADTPPPRYHALGDGPMSRSAVDSSSGGRGRRTVGRAKPILLPGRHHGQSSTSGYISDAESSETLTRSVYQSSASIEGAPGSSRQHHQHYAQQQQQQRTPKVVYTGPRGGGQHGARVELQNYSPYGSAAVVVGGGGTSLTPTPPPPQLPNGGPPSLPPQQQQHQQDPGYRTLPYRGGGSHPLKSFTAAVAPPPPPPPAPCLPSQVLVSTSASPRAAHVVRPVVVSGAAGGSPAAGQRQFVSAGGKPAGVVVGTKQVGRATPRVVAVPTTSSPTSNNHVYSSYGTCEESEPLHPDQHQEHTSELEHSRSLSTEELNAQMQNLDTMIDDLQAMQHEFNNSG